MALLIVVNHPKNWPLDIPGVQVVAARSYLTGPSPVKGGSMRVFNLCRSYRYQTTGYYVSLLAEARGHRPFPDVATIRDMQTPKLVRMGSKDLDDLIQKSLAPIQSKTFDLSIYFGRNLAKRYDRLALQLFNLFPTPLMRATFVRTNNRWSIQNIEPVGVAAIPESHRPFMVQVATDYFAGRKRRVRRKTPPRFYMAILHNPEDPQPPSNRRSLDLYIKAAARKGIDAELITRDDFGRLPEYDALFIRETTAVNNHTFRFARCAEREGLVVIDDSDSILKCTNKVYLAELLNRHKVRTPQTLVCSRENSDLILATLGLPCVLKQPDSAFSAGVVKVDTKEELREALDQLLEKSDLVVAQEYLRTDYDWRVGMLGGKPMYACKYYMARRHWQIIQRGKDGRLVEGRSETFSVRAAPRDVVRTAVRAANLIGKGLYGVDLKKVGNKVYVIEVNDNPSVDAGCEDRILKNELYNQTMGYFLKRLEDRVRG